MWFRTEEAAQGAIGNLRSRPMFQPWRWDENIAMVSAAGLRQELAKVISDRQAVDSVGQDRVEKAVQGVDSL